MDQAETKTGTGIAVTLALAIGLASLGASIANIALPALSAAFAAPFAKAQAVVVSYLAAMTVSVLVAGRLGDRYGLKPMLVAGLAMFAAAPAACALAPSLPMLAAARAAQGAGAGFLMTLAMALMRQTADAARVGRAMGLLGAVSAFGTALGPSLGGALIPLAGWRGVFWAQVPPAVLALALAVALLPRASGRAATSAASLRSALDRGLARNMAVNVLVAAVMMATLVVGPFYLALGLGLTPPQAGLVMAVGPAISIFSGVPAGRLVDFCGSARALAAGLVLLAVGALLLAVLPNAVGVPGYVLAVMALTPGYQLFQAANNTEALAEAPADRRGTISGLLALSRNAGLIAGASGMGAVFAFGAGAGDLAQASPAAIAAGMRLTFLVAAALTLLALAIARRRDRPPR